MTDKTLIQIYLTGQEWWERAWIPWIRCSLNTYADSTMLYMEWRIALAEFIRDYHRLPQSVWEFRYYGYETLRP